MQCTGCLRSIEAGHKFSAMRSTVERVTTDGEPVVLESNPVIVRCMDCLFHSQVSLHPSLEPEYEQARSHRRSQERP